MIRSYSLLLLCVAAISLSAQTDPVPGEVTYLSSKNIYVRFPSTVGINPGDTLFLKKSSDVYTSAAKVEYLSSVSVAAVRLVQDIKKGDTLFAYRKSVPVVDTGTSGKDTSSLVHTDTVVSTTPVIRSLPMISETRGRVSLYSSSLITNNGTDRQRWKTRLTLFSRDIFSSGFNFDAYGVFTFRPELWNEVTQSLGNGVRLYTLSVDGKIAENIHVTAGRHIRKEIVNAGAADGVTVVYEAKEITAGLTAGFMPHEGDYGFTINRPRFGAFVSREDSAMMNNSIGFIEQRLKSKTDRRFLYFQHSGTYLPNTSVFTSLEADLFENINEPKSTFSLTGLYISVTQRPFSGFHWSASYDERKQVVYYETYRSYPEALFHQSIRRGIRLGATWRVLPAVSVYGSFGHRFRKGDPSPANSFQTGLQLRQIGIPGDGTANIEFQHTASSFIKGDMISGSVRGYWGESADWGAGYKFYRFLSLYGSDEYRQQHSFFAESSVPLWGELLISLQYELYLLDGVTDQNVYAGLSYRFR